MSIRFDSSHRGVNVTHNMFGQSDMNSGTLIVTLKGVTFLPAQTC